MIDSAYLERVRHKKPLQRFIHYVNERYQIYLNRLTEAPRHTWTKDPILQTYKFTNVKRDWDFTSQWLINHWYTPKRRNMENAGIAAVFARFFCYVPTFEKVGFPETPYGLPAQAASRWLHMAQKVLVLASQQKEKVFTSAYMIAGGGSAGRNKVEWVINDIIRPIHASRILRSAWDGTVDELHEKLRTFNGMGDFMTQEVVLDLMKTFVLNKRPQAEIAQYGFAGPGALRGLNRIYRDDVESYAKKDSRDEMLDLWVHLRDSSTLNSVLRNSLIIHDVEFSLCEFDKYERILWGQGRPKQNFVPRSDNNFEQGVLL